MNKLPLPDGLYDLLVTQGIADGVDAERMTLVELDQGAPDRFAEAVSRQLSRILEEVDGEDSERALKQLDIVNELLVHLRERISNHGRTRDLATVIQLFARPPRLLTSVHQPGLHSPLPPSTGLANPWLFTAGKGTPSLLQEIRGELAACNQVDILVSFITVSGVRKLRAERVNDFATP